MLGATGQIVVWMLAAAAVGLVSGWIFGANRPGRQTSAGRPELPPDEAGLRRALAVAQEKARAESGRAEETAAERTRERAEAKRRIDALGAKVTALEAERTRLNSRLERADQTATSTRAESEASAARVAELQGRLDRSEKEHSDRLATAEKAAAERLATLQGQLTQTQKEHTERLAAAEKAAAERLGAVRAELERTEQERVRMRAEADTARRQSASTKREGPRVRELQQSVARLRGQIEETTATTAQQLAEARAVAEQATRERDALVARVSEADRARSGDGTALSAATARIEALQAEHDRTKAELAATARRLAEMDAAAGAAVDPDDVARLRRKLASLTATHAEAVRQLADLRAEMGAKRAVEVPSAPPAPRNGSTPHAASGDAAEQPVVAALLTDAPDIMLIAD